MNGRRRQKIGGARGLGGGEQATLTAVEEWAPPKNKLTRDEALAELTRRYFTSHGPAMLADFVWWSGLTTTDAKVGIELAKAQLNQATMGGQRYWFGAEMP